MLEASYNLPFPKERTSTSHPPHTGFTALLYIFLTEGITLTAKEETTMFLGIEWYWWLLIVLIVAVSIPFKVKFMKRIGKRQREKKERYYAKFMD